MADRQATSLEVDVLPAQPEHLSAPHPGVRCKEERGVRDKASLDIFWLRDESLEDTDNLPSPGVIAAEIVEDLQAALAEFTELADSLQGIGVEIESGE